MPSLAILAAAAGAFQALPQKVEGQLVLRLGWQRGDPGGASFEVLGLAPEVLTRLDQALASAGGWSTVFQVSVAPTTSGAVAPAMVGSYEVAQGRLRFLPRFPLEPGLRYHARVDAQALRRLLEGMAIRPLPPLQDEPATATFHIPKARAGPPPRLTRVFPSPSELPENLLRFYLHFSTPMSRGRSYEHIHLLDSRGQEVELPFLELGEELWDPSGTRFTLLLDPGRIKSGLVPREEEGAALLQGRSYTLRIDPTWLDARSQPLRTDHRKVFQVGPPDHRGPDPVAWVLDLPRAGTREPLAVHLLAPADAALLHDLVWVTDSEDRPVAGEVRIEDDETRWTLSPRDPWRAGSYALNVDLILEDVAGNRVDRPFEIDRLVPPGPGGLAVTAPDIALEDGRLRRRFRIAAAGEP